MNAIAISTKSVSVKFLVAWIAATAIGLIVGMFGTLPILWQYGDQVERAIGKIPAQLLGGVLFGLGVGLALGIAQWLALRLEGETSGRWIGGTLLGTVLGGALGIVLSASGNSDGGNAVVEITVFTLLGAFIAAGQYLLARSVVNHPLWIIAGGVGLGLAALPSLGLVPATDGNITLLMQLVGGLVYGAITGLALRWLKSRAA
jgi:hypothetical protein